MGAAAERIAGILADRGIDVSGRTILRWVQKFGSCVRAMRFRALDALQLIERGFVAVPCAGLRLAGGRSYVRTCHVAGIVNQSAELVQERHQLGAFLS